MVQSDPIENLIPALCQVFGLILLGYFSARHNLIQKTHAQGLSVYVTKFALPAVFFRVMITIDFSGVSWLFVLAVSLGKTVLFAATFIMTLILTRCSDFGLAGLLSMFTTQSNDVALAFPILNALYPNLASYIYLFAPIQLCILNPVSYFSLEWQSSTDTTVSKSRRILLVLTRVFLNPLFFMTVVGAIFNLILKHNIPRVLDSFLSVIAQSFSATALFYLGFSMVGKMQQLTAKGVYIIVLALTAKLIILPFAMREMVVLVNPTSSWHNASLVDLSTFAFLYGACPTAPPVFLFANEYQLIPEVMAAGLVIGTFLCAPIMFIFARIATIYVTDPDQYNTLLAVTVENVCSVSLALCVWTLAILLVSGKQRRFPHRFTLCLVVAVFLSCLGAFVSKLVSVDADRPATVAQYLAFVLFFIGCNSARLWALLIAIALYLQTRRGPHFVQRHQMVFYLVGFCIPTVTTAGLLIASQDKQASREINPIFQYGRPQVIISLATLVLCGFGSVMFLVLFVLAHHWHILPTTAVDPLRDEDEEPPLLKHDQEESSQGQINASGSGSLWSHPEAGDEQLQEDLLAQFDRHIVLTILLLITMFFGVCLCTWRLVEETPSGIYVVLEFLDGILNFGQGAILFALFGLDSELIVEPTKQVLQRLWNASIGRLLIATSHRRRQLFTVDLSTQSTPKNSLEMDRFQQLLDQRILTFRNGGSREQDLHLLRQDISNDFRSVIQ